MSVYRKLSKGPINRKRYGIPAIRSWAIRREGKTVQTNRGKSKKDWKKDAQS